MSLRENCDSPRFLGVIRRLKYQANYIRTACTSYGDEIISLVNTLRKWNSFKDKSHIIIIVLITSSSSHFQSTSGQTPFLALSLFLNKLTPDAASLQAVLIHLTLSSGFFLQRLLFLGHHSSNSFCKIISIMLHSDYMLPSQLGQ